MTDIDDILEILVGAAEEQTRGMQAKGIEARGIFAVIQHEGRELVFRRHWMLGSDAEKLRRNCRDAEEYLAGRGLHWTAIIDHGLGDKRRTFEQARLYESGRVPRPVQKALYELPCVDMSGVFRNPQESLRLPFPQELRAYASLEIWQTFDGWRFFHHINCWRLPAGAKKEVYVNTASGTSINTEPLPDRNAVIAEFTRIARLLYFGNWYPAEPDPARLAAFAAALDEWERSETR